MEIDFKEVIQYLIIIVILIIASQHLNAVVSGSMEPAFYRGDIVLIERADFFGIHEFDPNDVQVGDVVVYNAAWYEHPIIHRVINKVDINGSTMFVIKGDNNDKPDPYYVKPSQIYEKVVTIGDNLVVIPKLGYPSIWVKELLHLY
jgi:signal peptidase